MPSSVGVLAEFADALHRLLVDGRVVGILDTVGGPEPELPFLGRRQGAEESEADRLGTNLGSGVNDAVVVCEVIVAMHRVDDAAPRGRYGRDGQPQRLGQRHELAQAFRAEIRNAQPAVGRIEFGKSGVDDLIE